MIQERVAELVHLLVTHEALTTTKVDEYLLQLTYRANHCRVITYDGQVVVGKVCCNGKYEYLLYLWDSTADADRRDIEVITAEALGKHNVPAITVNRLERDGVLFAKFRDGGHAAVAAYKLGAAI